MPTEKIITFIKYLKMQEIKLETANPGPLGLAGFGMATILLNIHNMGLFPVDVVIVAMGIFLGGFVQVIVGSWEWKKNNMFGMIAFSGYGFFWLTLATILVLPTTGLVSASSPLAMGFYLTIWGLFTLGLFVATFTMNRFMQVLFGGVVVLFALLAIGDFTGIAAFKVAAGVEGVFVGGLSLYMAMAQVINEQFGRNLMPA